MSHLAATILESPDPQMTIDEINNESRPKIESKVSNLLKNSNESAFSEKLEFFKTIYSSKQPQDNIWDKTSKEKTAKIKIVEQELQKLTQETELIGKTSEDYQSNLEEIMSLSEKLQKIKEKLKKGKKTLQNTKVKFPKTKAMDPEGSSKGIRLEVEISNFLEQQKLIELHNEVTELENIVGKWDESKSVGSCLSDLLLKTSFLNENLLEKVKEQSRHLENDLETMLTHNTHGIASDDTVNAVEKISFDTLEHFKVAQLIPNIIEKLRIYHPVFMKSVEVDKAINSYEGKTLLLEDSIQESLEALKELKSGIAENSKKVLHNISLLSKKIT